MYDKPMDGIARGTDAPAVQSEPGCEGTVEQPAHLDAAQLDLVAGLVQLSFLVQDIYARASERHDVTPTQAKLLCIVADAPRGMAELARCFGVEKAALTGLVDRAERRGLAERTAVPGDRRAVRVAPTEAGCQTATAFKAEVVAELYRLVSGLSPQDCEDLRRALAAIVTAYGPPRHEGNPRPRCESICDD
jgi:DNA-binding MarR family transcriptional regulator